MTGRPSTPSPEALARLLRQRRELGLPAVVLEGLSREEALVLARTRPSGENRAEGPRAGGDPARRSGTEPAAPAPTPPTPASPAPAAPGLESVPEDHDALQEVALACRRCRLADGRTQVVFSDGNPEGRVMVVGEAPGAHEDRTGLPFVGQAGKLLDLLLGSVGLSRRESVYICNVLKCRPPGNRDPRPDEIEACAPYLRRQIDVMGPEAILAVGTFAAKLLSGEDRPLGKLRGEIYSYEGAPLVVTYHPAALLRNPGWTRATWEDLQLLRQVLDGR